jgi:hypothetical protein
MQSVRPDLKLRFLPLDRPYVVRIKRSRAVLETQLQFARIPATAFSLRGYPEAAITMRSRGMNDLLLGALLSLGGRSTSLGPPIGSNNCSKE